MNTLIVNLFGGPGCGKSSMMFGIAAKLKWGGVDVEIAPEYAKECVWGGNTNILNNQVYVFGKQQNRLFRLNNKVDVVVTDSPLMLSVVYDILCRKDLSEDYRQAFHNFVIKEQARYNNFNIFLNRVKPYKSNGRLQTEEEAKNLDTMIQDTLISANMQYITVDGAASSIPYLVDTIKSKINKHG